MSQVHDEFLKIHQLWTNSAQLNAASLNQIVANQINNPVMQSRILNEFLDLGPLNELWQDPSITEILINAFDSIWIERNGILAKHNDTFLTQNSYQQFLERIVHEAGSELTIQSPYLESRFRKARLTVLGSELTKSQPVVSLRRPALQPWTLEMLREVHWCNEDQKKSLESLIHKRINFFVAGATGVGKTSLLSALLAATPSNERCLIIEDTEEIELPNEASLRLLTRNSQVQSLREFDQNDLIKRALRMRPDRLILGEVRGHEAKDLLMALSSGHSGSFGSIHAQDPHQALYRLETLIQMGAPQWSVQTVRRLIQLGLQYVLVLQKNEKGQRYLEGAYKICSLEEYGFCLERSF